MKQSRYKHPVDRWHGWKLLAFWIPALTLIVSAYVGFFVWLT